VTVDGRDLGLAYRDGAALDRADEDAHPVVFLHGIPTWSFLWRRIAPPLEPAVRAVVPDLVGYGNSDRRDCFDRSLRAQEQALAGLVDRLGAEAVSLVGHDIGGGVALRYAAHTDRVEKLVLSNATCYDSWPVEYIATLGLPRTQTMADGDFEDALDEAFVGGLTADPDPEWTEGIAAPWRRGDGKRAFARAAVATNTNHTTEIDYGAIDADLLCLWGDVEITAERTVDLAAGTPLRWSLEERSPFNP